MIKRDEYNIICQHSNDPSYMDGGDSAARTGIMAMTGSQIDRQVMSMFEEDDGVLVRHPHQFPYNDPRSFTRDQLLQFTAGFLLPLSNKVYTTAFSRRIFFSRMRSLFLCQNTDTLYLNKKEWWNRDILTPSHIGHLIKVAKIKWLYPFLLFSWSWLILDILYSTKVKPFDESNQIIAMCSVAGDWALKLYCSLHPDWKKSINDYWAGWRDQKEIGEALISYIDKRVILNE